MDLINFHNYVRFIERIRGPTKLKLYKKGMQFILIDLSKLRAGQRVAFLPGLFVGDAPELI